MRYHYAFVVLAIVFLATYARAQDGHIRHGHDQWHAGFYSKLQRPGNKGSCCNLSDCRPTSTRTVNEAYEIKKDGRWIPLPLDKVLRITAPTAEHISVRRTPTADITRPTRCSAS